MLKELKPGIWKINADSNIYVIKEKGIVIDTGFRMHRRIIEEHLKKIVDLNQVKKVIFTHLHMDHVGNFDLFPNAKYYASQAAIDSLTDDKMGTILDPSLVSMFNVTINPLGEELDGIKVILTPGHTHGSICLLYDGILFTGDTKFKDGQGRIDLPTSDPEAMEASQKIISDIKYDILAPGHDY